MPRSYSIHLFGKPYVASDAAPADIALGLGKPLALLSYLIIEGKTSRDEAIGLLWGDVPEEKARNAFRQALHRLRAALDDEVIPHNPDFLLVAPAVAENSDVRRFERLLDAGRLNEAIDEYGGDFLAGLDVGESAFDEWRDRISKRYKARFRDALRTVIPADLDSGEISRALRRAAVLVSTEPGDAEAAMLHASTLLGAGRRAEAQQVLEEFERQYKQDVDAATPAAVRDFLSRLRRARDDQQAKTAVRERHKFVGRNKELSILLARLHALVGGGGSLVIIDGEEGIGKTQLIDEFLVRARDMGSILILRGRERSPDAGISYASVGEAMRGVLDAPGIAGTGQHLLAEAARLLPQLRDRFSLPAVAEMSDDASRLRFYEGIAALLDSVAYEQPVCIALDDFHNCSPATFGLVEYLAERLSSAPILFVIVGRTTPGFTAGAHKLRLSLSRLASARNERAPAHIALGPLDHLSARTLAEDLNEGVSTDLSADDVAEMTSGIPFRIIEACARIRSGIDGSNTPVRIRDVLWARLQRSTQAEQRLFVAAALFDRPVSIRLLAAASHLPEKSALDAALILERDGLLQQSAEGVVPAHDFSGELAVEGTGPAGRALLAGWAADALERDSSGSSAELARLFALAGRRKEAYDYSRTAAFEAMALGASEEAKRHLSTALATAPNRDEREEMAKLLRVLGAGGLLLGGGNVPPPAASPSAGQPEGAHAAPELEGPHPAANRARQDHRAPALRSVVAAGAALVIIVLLAFRFAATFTASRTPGTSLADSLIVARELDPRDTVIAFATGQLGSPLQALEGATRHGLTRSWIDSLALPWANALPSPDGHNVAIERITKNGSELYVISMDRRDTISLRSGEGDDFSSGWSPDGRWLLATHGESRSDGTYSAELFGYSVYRGGPRIAFDTSRSAAVVEAVWSPDGSHVAWTARVGAQHQQDVFVSDADGQNVENISNSPAEDYSIAWSPDGKTLAFTSERTGRAELYAVGVETRALRRLTWEGAHADHAAFSPDGRWLAYESTRGGNPAVYVMPSGGGTGRSVTTPAERVSLVGWRGRAVPYIDQILVELPPLSTPGDTATLLVRALDRHGNAMKLGDVRIRVLDPTLIRLSGTAPRASDSVGVTALASGLARITASAGNWRADTAFIPIGTDPLALVEEHFDGRLKSNVWRLLGDPTPVVGARAGAAGSPGLIARSDREWESGLLSRVVVPVRRGLTADVWVSAPFTAPAAARSFVVALVAADPVDVIDSQAPHFLRLAAVSWLGEAGRIGYSVGRETFTESLSSLGNVTEHRIRISIEDDEAVAFFVDGRLRWKSSLRVLTAGANSRAQLWVGSQATGNLVAFDDIVLRLQPMPPRNPQ